MEAETWAPIGIVDGYFGLHDAVGTLQRWLQTIYSFTTATAWAARVPGEVFLRALGRLLAAWPAGRKRLEQGPSHRVTIWLGVVPEWVTRRAPGRSVEAVVATALWHVCGGLEPEEAIRRAHEDPWGGSCSAEPIFPCPMRSRAPGLSTL